MKKLILFLSTVFYFNASYASESTTKISSENRKSKSFIITAGESFSDQAGMVSTTFSVGKVINEKNIVSIEASSYAHISPLFMFGFEKQEKWGGASTGIHYRYFPGSSFNLRLGLDYRTITYSRILDNGVLTFSDYTADFVTNSTVASIAIGNQWQWDNFTLGIDWLGYSQPVSGNVSSITYSGNVDAVKMKYTEDKAKELALNGSSTAFKIYLGASF